jgi:transposase
MRFESVDISIEELDQLVEEAAPVLSEENNRKLRALVNTIKTVTELLVVGNLTIEKLRRLLLGRRSSEKTRKVLGDEGKSKSEPQPRNRPQKGHGRNGAADYQSAPHVRIEHPTLKPKDRCPECLKGKVYPVKEERSLVRIVGRPPLEATVYQLETLRCNLCDAVFTPPAPEEAGPDKYHPTAVSMIALLKYGAGFPFYRQQRLESYLGIPLPASTAWELVAVGSQLFMPVWEELIQQAAQGAIVHNDDTYMRILCFVRQASDTRRGLFTTGIVSACGQHLIALFYTGPKHAGENLADLLARRNQELGPPIQMCDALSRNAPGQFNVILGNCLAHARRHFVDVVHAFPDHCRYVLETFREVFHHDERARQLELDPHQRLAYHQQHSKPLMDKLNSWCKEQFDRRLVEPNSGLGKAIQYLFNHWEPLTLFLRQPNAPITSNIVERALKKSVLHRKNSLFYRTQNGARVGDLFMSLIYTAELCGANAFDYLTQLQRHPEEVARAPARWLPWNYRDTLLESSLAA